MMILLGPEEGHYALAIACILALYQGVFAFVFTTKRNNIITQLIPSLAWAHCIALSLSFICLELSAIRDDFSVQNIAENSSLTKPLLYKITGVWGNHEGSILLWIVILSLFSARIAYKIPVFSTSFSRFYRHTLGTLGFISAAFDLFCLLTSNPFKRLFPMPTNGLGMNPLLQDPGLALHPPLLYAGYVGFSVPFAYAVSTLINYKSNPLWEKSIRSWTIGAWSFLTAGITLGSWWSYYVLGWGGYWFWDPVENASLIPWLSGTALLHSVIITEKRGSLKVWTLLLAISTFCFSLSGTFLVRSGILNSVHAFANDPERGAFILIILALIIGSALTLFAWRAPLLTYKDTFKPLSRESALVVNSILLCTLCTVVLTGTLYPPFIQLLFGHTISVGKPFFDITTIPIAIPTLFIMGGGLALSWGHTTLRQILRRLFPTFIISLLFSLPTLYFFSSPLAALCAILSIWVISSSIIDFIRYSYYVAHPLNLPHTIWGVTLAHIGVGITILGICGMSAAQHTIVTYSIGEHHTLSGNDWQLTNVRAVSKSNYHETKADLLIRHNKHIIACIHPSMRTFNRPHQTISRVAIHSSIIQDFYAVLGAAEQDGQTTHYILRLHQNPLASWIWIGGGIMAMGGIISLLTNKRHKTCA